MATISQIRAGIAARLDTIEGLRVSDYVPDQINPPMAVVFGPEIDYDSTMQRGSDDMRFSIILLTSRVSDRSGQTLLDSYLSPAGAASVKVAVEAEQTLGGTVDYARVSQVREYGSEEINATTYYTAAVTVEVCARP